MKNTYTLLFLLIIEILFAQKKVDITLNLRDGSIISGTTALNDVILKTNYGVLTIPIQNISTVVVGIGFDKGINDKAISYLKILNGAQSDDLKKGANTDLINLGIKAISSIVNFQNDNAYDTEIINSTSEYTIDNALNELKGKFNINDASSVNDVLTIDNEYTMGGLYEFSLLDVKTEYGALQIPKEKIKNFDISYSQPSANGELIFKLMANKHISGNANGGWLKTNIKLKQGQKFSITANGEVTLASLSNQKYKPDGAYTASNTTDYPVSETATTGNYPSYGNVVYKIGITSNETNRAGGKYTGTANATGILFIAIYETVFDAKNTGIYTVKINLK